MNFIGNSKSYKEVEKNQLINHLKNELRIIKDDNQKIDNVDLLIFLMNFVEMYYNEKGSGPIKEDVVRSVLDRCSVPFLNQMIPFIVSKQLLKPKTLRRKILAYFKKKNLQRRLRRIL